MTKRKRTPRERARKWDYALSIAEAVVLGYRLAGYRAGKKDGKLGAIKAAGWGD